MAIIPVKSVAQFNVGDIVVPNQTAHKEMYGAEPRPVLKVNYMKDGNYYNYTLPRAKEKGVTGVMEFSEIYLNLVRRAGPTEDDYGEVCP